MSFSIRYDEDVSSHPCERDRFARPFRASRAQAIWRFLPPSRALQLITRNGLYLSAFDTFADKLEGRLPVWTVEYWRKQAAENGWPSTQVEKFLTNLQARRAKAFASCWRGDAALWMEGFDRYSNKNEQPVCIESHIGKLADRVLLFLEHGNGLAVTCGASGEPRGVTLSLPNLEWIDAIHYIEGGAGVSDLISTCTKLGVPAKSVPK